MSDVWGKLGNVVEVTNLTGWVAIGAGVESESEWFMIREDMEGAAFEEVTEVFDGEVDG